MPRRIRIAHPLALLCAALAVPLAGCGAPGPSSSGGQVSLTVTRDFGARPVASVPPPQVQGAEKALDLLQRSARVTTGTAGDVLSVDGAKGAWSLFVNGVRAAPGRAKVRSGDRVWWDLRDRGGGPAVPAVVGSFPEPFLHGVAGKRVPIRVECVDPASAPCAAVADALTGLGLVAARGGLNAGSNDQTLRVVVGAWPALRASRDEAVRRIDGGPSASGVFARFDASGGRLAVLDVEGNLARTLGAGTGLVAATRIAGRQPVWLVTGTDERGVASAARALDESALAGSYALAVSADRGVPVPAAGR